MLVVNLSINDVEKLVGVLQDTLELTEDSVGKVTEEDLEEQEAFVAELRRYREAFNDSSLYLYTELVEKVLGYFWDRFEEEGGDNPDVEYLMDMMSVTEAELALIFEGLGYEKE